MRTKYLVAWIWILLWFGFSCGQGRVNSWENTDGDGGQRYADLQSGDGTGSGDQDSDLSDADAKPVADGDEGFADIGPDSSNGDDTLSDAGGGDEEDLTCLSGQLPVLGGLSPEELHTALDNKNFLLINVASASGGQIAGTDTYIPYNDTEALVGYIGSARQTRVILYCVSSGRSGVAGKSLVARGYCSIRHLLGGMNAWTAAGFSLE